MELFSSSHGLTVITLLLLILLALRFAPRRNWVIMFELLFIAIGGTTCYAGYERYNSMKDIIYGIDLIAIALYLISAICVVSVIIIEVKKAFQMPDKIRD